jgi:hypothetical protein
MALILIQVHSPEADHRSWQNMFRLLDEVFKT